MSGTPRRRLFDDLVVDIRDGGQFIVGIGGQRLAGRTAAAAAGTDQADLDGVRDRLAGDDAGETGRDDTGDRPGLLEEVAPLNLVRSFWCGRHKAG